MSSDEESAVDIDAIIADAEKMLLSAVCPQRSSAAAADNFFAVDEEAGEQALQRSIDDLSPSFAVDEEAGEQALQRSIDDLSPSFDLKELLSDLSLSASGPPPPQPSPSRNEKNQTFSNSSVTSTATSTSSTPPAPIKRPPAQALTTPSATSSSPSPRLKGAYSPAAAASPASDEEDDISSETLHLHYVEQQIRDEVEASLISYAIGSLAASPPPPPSFFPSPKQQSQPSTAQLLSYDSFRERFGSPISKRIAKLSQSMLSAADGVTLDCGINIPPPLPPPTPEADRKSLKDVTQAQDLLKGTELLKLQLQQLALMSRRDESTGDIIIGASPSSPLPPTPQTPSQYPSPPPSHPTLQPPSLERHVSDNNYLTLKITSHDEFSKDVIEKVSTANLHTLFSGLSPVTLKEVRENLDVAPADAPSSHRPSSRCVFVRVRPDVLCESIMDAVCTASMSPPFALSVERRMNGHCILSLPWVELDAQVCVKRRDRSRYLIVRAFAVEGFAGETRWGGAVIEKLPEEKDSGGEEIDDDEFSAYSRLDSKFEDDSSFRSNLALTDPQEEFRNSEEGVGNSASAATSFASQAFQLVDRIAKPIKKRLSGVGVLGAPASPDEKNLDLVLYNTDATSVAIWPVFSAVLEELESRDLLFSSLKRCPFGAFPALEGGFDTHFCTQLKYLSRESMVVGLVRAGSELEEYARAAEFSTASLIELLRPIFELYQLPEVALPKPVPLSSYPIDFTPPELVAPPWGVEVNEALEQVERELAGRGGWKETAIKSDDFAFADECVAVVHAAFNKYFDHEYIARIGRKNMQVMDRLSKMSTHKERMFNALAGAVSASAKKDSGIYLGGEVPVFWCRVVHGMEQGRLFITKSSVTLVGSVALGLGGESITRIALEDIVDISAEGANRVSLVTGIGGTTYSFSPLALSASRLVDLIESVKVVNLGSTLRFTDDVEGGGLLYDGGGTGGDGGVSSQTDDDFAL